MQPDGRNTGDGSRCVTLQHDGSDRPVIGEEYPSAVCWLSGCEDPSTPSGDIQNQTFLTQHTGQFTCVSLDG
jgi:hypothetical protein